MGFDSLFVLMQTVLVFASAAAFWTRRTASRAC